MSSISHSLTVAMSKGTLPSGKDLTGGQTSHSGHDDVSDHTAQKGKTSEWQDEENPKSTQNKQDT